MSHIQMGMAFYYALRGGEGMTFLKQCASHGLQRIGYSRNESELLIEWLYPASTMEIIQSKLRYNGRFDSKKIFK